MGSLGVLLLSGCVDPLVGSWELDEDNEADHLEGDLQAFDAELTVTRDGDGEFHWESSDEIERFGGEGDVDVLVAASPTYTIGVCGWGTMTCELDEPSLRCELEGEPAYVFQRD